MPIHQPQQKICINCQKAGSGKTLCKHHFSPWKFLNLIHFSDLEARVEVSKVSLHKIFTEFQINIKEYETISKDLKSYLVPVLSST